MKLRTRLIVSFLVLSVLPLGVVTYFSYTNQVRALRDLAARDADALSSEMTQRMQLVTTELSTRVEQLAQIEEPPVVRVARVSTPVESTRVPANARTTTTSAVQEPSAEQAAEAATTAMNQAKVAEALGTAAMFLQTVEFQGMRGASRPSNFGRGEAGPGRGGATPGRGEATGQRGDPRVAPSSSAGESAGRGRGAVSRPKGSPAGEPAPAVLAEPHRTPPPSPPAAAPPSKPPTASSASTTARGGAARGPSSDTTRRAEDVTPVPPVPPAGLAIGAGPLLHPDRVVIDMGAIAREMFSKYVPEGGFEKMTPDQRQQLAREVNLRMMGIAEGIRLSAQQLQKKAEAAKAEAETATPAAAPKPSAPTPPASPKPQPPPKPVTRTSSLVGNRLDVKLVQDGKVVREVNATIDLENVLATVFSPTRRERGEVPFAVGPDGKVYTATDADRRTVEDLGPIARPDGPLGKTTLPDWIVFTTVDPSGSGLRFGIARPVGDSLDDLRRTAGRNAGLGLLVIGIAIVGVVPLSGRLTRPLTALTDAAGRIARGDYRARVPVRRRDEIGELAVAFNHMAEDVERHQHAAVEQERLRRELELGRQIQSEMLPHEPLLLGLTEVQGISIPAREVGGDFFNYFALDNGRIALIVGDVSGKGVGAALLMASIQASLRTRLALGQDLSAIAEALDRETAATSSRLYVTLFLGIFDPVSRRLDYVNAGHNPQFVLRPGQPLERMAATGIPMGLLAGRGYAHREVSLASGDLLFFYTDGCVEFENQADEMFGAERLEALLVSIAAAGPSTPDRVLQHVEEAVTAFRGIREPNDDATMMAVRVG